MIRCKFFVSEIATGGYNSPTGAVVTSYTYKLHAVNSQDPNHENKAFWSATPSGVLTFQTTKPMQLAVGQEYYLDLSTGAAVPVTV